VSKSKKQESDATVEFTPMQEAQPAPNEDKIAEHLRRRQEFAASKKKGRNIILMKSVEEGLIVEAGENQALRSRNDVFEYLEDHCLVGTFHLFRQCGKPVSRYEQKVMVME
jgi:hypothetical protein